VSDYATRFATVQLDEVMAAMQQETAIDGIMKSDGEKLFLARRSGQREDPR
jgi:hypothetical protein